MKIVIITCYAQADYVRARTLRAGFAACSGVEMIVIKNKQKGVLRYPEVFWKVLKVKFREKPDAYMLTFRAYEILLYMALLKGRKPLIFDELVNFAEWMEEHGKLKSGTALYRLFAAGYGWFVRRCRFILADTEAHAAYSAKIWGLSEAERFRTIPVAADETIFKPAAKRPGGKNFKVFYYGFRMAPLHGLEYVLDAAVQLADNPNISFFILGGKEQAAAAVEAARAKGAHAEYQDWVPFEEFPKLITDASLALGGPFGDTLQAQFVITGKTYQFLACQTATVVGQTKVTEKYFVDKQNCLLVPLADGAALAKAIQWAYDHPKEREAIAAAGRQLYEKHLSQAVVNEQLQALVAELTP